MTDRNECRLEEMLALIAKLPEPQRTELLRFVCAGIYEEDGALKIGMQDHCGQLKRQ